MLPKAERLRKARDFALLSQKGRAVFHPLFTLRFRPSSQPSKVGFVASTKVFKTAVLRNRAKRRMREALRLMKTDWPKNMDLLFILKAEVVKASFPDIRSGLARLFEKVPEALSKPPVPRKKLKARRPTSVVYKGKEV